jgi:hypothetical protein
VDVCTWSVEIQMKYEYAISWGIKDVESEKRKIGVSKGGLWGRRIRKKENRRMQKRSMGTSNQEKGKSAYPK